jgi:hypothetical protein
VANKSFVVQYLIKAREQYVTVAGKVSRASEKMRKSIERTKKAFVAASAKMRRAGAIMSAAVTLPIAFLANSLKNAARDAEETSSKFAQVFKDVSAESKAAADNLAQNFGLASTTAKDLLADTGDLLVGFGFSGKAALKLSTEVNELAVDLASFKNFSGGAKGASDALTKALLGERESLKSLGVAILEKDVKTKVSQLLAEGQRFATMRQAKAVATLALAVEQSKSATGDFALTQEQLANQERITSERTKELKESFGKVLLPVALKITQAIRGAVVWLTALSPGTKKAILVVAALAAVLGPLLLAFGSIALIIPALTAGFAAFGVIAIGALGPIGILAGILAAAAVIVINNWDRVRAFFSGFASGIQSAFGPATVNLIESFKEAASIIAGLFSSDSEAARSLFEFSNLGELVGKIIGGTLDLIIRGLRGIGTIIGQVIGAVTTLDFSAFDIEAIKAEFSGTQAKPILAQTRVDVGVNVGLDQGLKQTGAASITGPGARRTDVGMATP